MRALQAIRLQLQATWDDGRQQATRHMADNLRQATVGPVRTKQTVGDGAAHPRTRPLPANVSDLLCVVAHSAQRTAHWAATGGKAVAAGSVQSRAMLWAGWAQLVSAQIPSATAVRPGEHSTASRVVS